MMIEAIGGRPSDDQDQRQAVRNRVRAGFICRRPSVVLLQTFRPLLRAGRLATRAYSTNPAARSVSTHRISSSVPAPSADKREAHALVNAMPTAR